MIEILSFAIEFRWSLCSQEGAMTSEMNDTNAM